MEMFDDPLSQKLSRLTPNGSRLDRDALMFTAGRASARPDRRWMGLAAALAACQLATMGWLLRPGQFTPGSGTSPVSPAIVANAPSEPDRAMPDRLAAWRVSSRFLAGDESLETASVSEGMEPFEPPLRAFGAPPPALLN